jgi:hypothetical protein
LIPTVEPTSIPTITYLPTSIPTSNYPTFEPSGLDNVFVCVGASILMGYIDSASLYSPSSKRAIIAGIATSTGIPYDDVMFEKNKDSLCPTMKETGKFHIIVLKTFKFDIHYFKE